MLRCIIQCGGILKFCECGFKNRLWVKNLCSKIVRGVWTLLDQIKRSCFIGSWLTSNMRSVRTNERQWKTTTLLPSAIPSFTLNKTKPLLFSLQLCFYFLFLESFAAGFECRHRLISINWTSQRPIQLNFLFRKVGGPVDQVAKWLLHLIKMGNISL